MDFPAHLFWTLALTRRYSWTWEAAFWGVLPDLLFGIPAIALMLRMKSRDYGRAFPKIEPAYRWGHSAIVMLAAFAIASVISSRPYYPLLAGWGLHLLLDLWTHKGGFANGQIPFYPISMRRVAGKWWWKEEAERRPWLVAANYALAGIAYFLS